MSGLYPDDLTQATFDEAQDQEEGMSDEKSDEVNTSLDQISRGIDILADERDQLRSQLVAVTAERDALRDVLEERRYAEQLDPQLATYEAARLTTALHKAEASNVGLACAVERMRKVLESGRRLERFPQDIGGDLWLHRADYTCDVLKPEKWCDTCKALSTPPSADAEAVRELVAAADRAEDWISGVLSDGWLGSAPASVRTALSFARDLLNGKRRAPALAWARPTPGRG